MTATKDLETGSVLADLGSVLESLRAVGERVAPDRVWSCRPAEIAQILRAGQEIAAAVAAIELSAVREADVLGLAQDAGQSSTAVWLAHLLRLSPGETAARVKDADTACRKSPDLGFALAHGAVNGEQSRAIAGACARSRRSPPPRNTARPSTG